MHETDILINDLKERVRINREHIRNRVNAKGEPLTDLQLENLKTITDAQSKRLGEMVEQYADRRTKETSDT